MRVGGNDSLWGGRDEGTTRHALKFITPRHNEKRVGGTRVALPRPSAGGGHIKGGPPSSMG